LSAAGLDALNAENRSRIGSAAGDARSIAASQRSKAVSVGRKSYVSSVRSKAESKAYSEINENDEWVAIQKFNTLLHYEEQKQ
jgi:hypothetical protein